MIVSAQSQSPMSHPSKPHSRRTFLRRATKLIALGGLSQLARSAAASLANARALSFSHTHTGEQLSLVYAIGNDYVPASLTTLNHFLRDHYSGEVGVLDPRLFDLLFRVQRELGNGNPFEVISGYRSPQTNSMLRHTRGGGVAKHSLHMDGKAIDLRIAGTSLADLRDAAISLHEGGVGYYESAQFVHIDTGRFRTW